MTALSLVPVADPTARVDFDDEEQVSQIITLDRPQTGAPDYAAKYRRLLQLLSKGRFEAAYDLLCSVRDAFPGDEALGRSIRLLRDHLSAKYATRLEDLDVVPCVVRRGVPLEEHERRVLSLVDGVSSFGELLLTSPLAQFDTLRALHTLIHLGVIADDVVASASRRPPPPTEVGPTPGPVEPTPTEVRRLLAPLEALDGFWGSALVDSASGRALGVYGADPGSLEQLGVIYGELLQAERRATEALGLGEPEDLIITRSDEYHLLRPLRGRPDLFICLITRRPASNLMLSRLALAEVDHEVDDALFGLDALDVSYC